MKIIIRLFFLFLIWTSTVSSASIVYPASLTRIVPVYPDSTMTGVETSSQSTSASLVVRHPIEIVSDFYTNYLKDHMWMKVSSLNSPDGLLMLFSKKYQTLSVYVLTENEETTILLTHEW